MKLRPVAVALLIVGGLLAAPAALAEDEEGQSLEERIKQKMERILELMRKNEKALMKLSTGAEAETRRIDVPVPEGEPDGSGSGASESGSASGKEAAEELERLMKSSREEGGKIPDELKELVEMIPL